MARPVSQDPRVRQKQEEAQRKAGLGRQWWRTPETAGPAAPAAPAAAGVPTAGPVPGRPWIGPQAPTPWAAAAATPVVTARPSPLAGQLMLPTVLRTQAGPRAVPSVGVPPEVTGAPGAPGAAPAGRERPGLPAWMQGAPELPGATAIARWLKRSGPAYTAERISRRIGEIWRGLRQPVEAGPTVAEVAAQGVGPARAGKPVGVAEMWAAPAMGGAPAGGEARPEAVGEILGGAGGRAMEMAGAAWRQTKGLPVVGPAARTVGAVAGTGMEVLQAPAMATEEMISKGIGQRVGGEYGLWSLAPATQMTEEQKAVAAQVAQEKGMPLWLAQQGVLAAGRQGTPSLREYARQTYGEIPQVQEALGRLATGLGYSSYEAQTAGLDRLMAGEDLEVVANGRQVNVMNPTAEDMTAFHAYIEGVRRGQGEDAAAAQQVKETGMIPGQSDTWNELLFQVGLDPLNLLDIGAWQKGMEARKARAAARFAEAAEMAPEAAKVAGAAEDVAQYADDVARGVGRALEHVDEAAVAVGKTDDAQQVGALRRLWERINPFAPTARATAETMAGTAYQVVTPAVLQVENADEARAMVRAMVENPQALTGALGNIPLSQAAEEARPLLAQVLDDLGDARKFPSLGGGEFDRLGFLADLDAAMAERALEMTGAAVETKSGYQRFVDGFRSTMSEYYLRTPGYAIRNAIGDTMTMAYDGVASLDGRGAIDDFMERIGPTTRRVAESAAAGSQAEIAGTRLPGKLGELSGRWGAVIGQQEEGRYTRAFYSALKKTLGEMWTPALSDELAELLDPDTVRALNAGLAGSLNADEMAEVVARVTGEGTGRLMSVGAYLDHPDDLSVGLRLQLEKALGQATNVDEVDEAVDAALAASRDNFGRALAADPTPPGRRVWSDFEAVQDLREEQGWMEALGASLGVAEDDVVRATDTLADALAPGQAGIRQTEEALIQAVGGQFDEDTANLIRQVRAETGRMNAETRAAADALRAEAWRRVKEGESSAAVWGTYFPQVKQLHLDNQQAVLARLQDGVEQVGRLRAGETLEELTGRPAKQLVEESLAQLRALAGDVAARQERLRRMGLEDFVNFDEMLDAQRLTVDTAEAEAWRLMGMNPTRDGLDVVLSTQDGVDRLARAAADEAARARAMFLQGRMSKAQYAETTSKVWRDYFRDASQGWDLARWELAQLPLSPGAQQKALQALGWPAEEAAKLATQEVAAVLGAGVRWDPLLNAPTVPLEEALRGTLMEVASAAGLDVARSADWSAEDWRRVAEQARSLGDQAGTRASAAGRLGQAAVEEAAEAAAIAPRTVEQGMQLTWPQSVDDVARSMGVRPQAASMEEWAEVARYADGQAQEARLLGDEFGRRSVAALEAERLPEWGQVGGQEAMVRRGRLSFAQEQERVAELTGEARTAAEQTMSWVLRESGFADEEVQGLTFAQRQRLTEEIGQGDLLRTGAGRPAKIDAIEPERRQAVLSQLSQPVREAAFGVGMEPESAVGYRWQELAEEARRRAGGSRVMVAAPGTYDAAGFPVAREVRRPMVQRPVVERAIEMVPEEQRLGRGRAMVGFEQQQAALADRYADLQEMARARAGLAEEGRRIGEALDVPVGAVGATTEKAAGMYGLNLLDENNRVVRTYWYDNWADVRRARDEARGIIEAGAQGQAAAVGTAWSAWGTEDVMRADRRAAAAGGYALPPTLADMTAVQHETEARALERVRQWAKADLAVAEEMAPVPPATRERIMQWVKGELARQWSQTRTVAVDVARQAADFSNLDYAGGRKRFDQWIGMVCPYTYWMTRSARNWALRGMERPGLVAAYVRYQKATQRASEERGYRPRFAGAMEIPIPGMAKWTGGSVFFNPTNILFPWAQIGGTEMAEEEPRNVVEQIYRVGQRLGLRTYGFIEWPLQYFGWIGKKEEMGFVLPHTGAIQAVTAAAGVGPPGGVNVEAWARRAAGLPEQEPFGAYRVARMLGNMAAEEPGLSQAALRAQELQRLVEAGELRQNEAMGWESGRPRGAPVASSAVLRVARDQGWSEAELEEAQGLLQEATRRAGLERGLRAGTSFFAGVPLSMYPAGERRQVELEREERGAMYAPLTRTGTREELLQWRQAHPEVIPRRLARAALPGAAEYAGWKPGEAVTSNVYNQRRDEINRTYDEAVDAILRQQPWNREQVKEMEEQRQAELERVRMELGIGEGEERAAAVYQPRTTYGATPEEAAQIRREEVLGIVSSAMPHVADFQVDGQPDYEAYNAAVAQFFQELPQRMGTDERLAAVAGVMGRQPAELLADVDQEEVTTYWRRNDRPLEAAQRVWEDTVYRPAWEAYNRAVEGGMEKGKAYEGIIEAAGKVQATALIARIQQEYPGRWTEEELREALKGTTFPGVGEATTLRKPEEERVLAQASSAFWDFLNEQLPPGKMGQGARDNTLVQLVLDAETRGTATAEQYQKALEWLTGWKAQNQGAEWLTPADWAAAREQNDEFQALADKEWPGIQDTLGRYYDLSGAERTAFKKEHPEIGEYFDARDAWGAQAGHGMWAYFYQGKTTAGAGYAAGVGGGKKARAAYRPRTYYKKKGKARRPTTVPDWVFAQTARRVPKVFLKTPSPWGPEKKTYEKPYRARGVPWIVGRWAKK